MYCLFLDNFELSTLSERVRGKMSGAFRVRTYIKTRCSPDIATIKSLGHFFYREATMTFSFPTFGNLLCILAEAHRNSYFFSP